MDAPFACPRIQFISPLGTGGTAEVARAVVSGYSREVAVKYPGSAPDGDVDFSTLARREYEMIGRSAFPGLVQILEEPSENPPFLLLQLCEGPTLDRIGRVADTPLLLALLSSMTISIEYLNAAGLVHGDIKPQNFFLPQGWESTADGRLFYIRLSDFSLGRRYDEEESSRLGMGTLGYAAPEILSSGAASHRSDLFALGVVAYQLACGNHPFLETSSDPVQVNDRIQSGTFPPLGDRTALPDDLIDLIHRLLAVNPDDRPDSAWSVCRTLADIGSPYPFRKALRPAHLITGNRDYECAVNRTLARDDLDRERLDILTEKRVERLRLLLTANFIRGNLGYQDGRFYFRNRIYWPACFRHRLLDRFTALSITEKKTVIETAVTGSKSDANLHRGGSKALSELLLPLLRPATTKRISASRGPSSLKDENHRLAARLFLQAGQLEPAEQHAEQAALALHKEHRNREAVHLLDGILEYASDTNQMFSVRHILMTRADILKQSGDADRAMRGYQRIIELYDNRSPDKILAEAYKDIGDIYKMKQQADEGLEALDAAMKIYEELDDQLEVSHTLNNMGNLFYLRGDPSNVLSAYRRALYIQRRHNSTVDVASTLSNLGAFYATFKGRYGRAIRLMRLALERQYEVGNPGEIARTLNNIGHLHLLRGELGEAESYIRKSLDINRRIGSKKEVLHNLDNLSSGLISAGHLKESLEFLDEGLVLSNSAGLRTLHGALQLKLGTVYKRLGRIREAVACFDIARDALETVDDVEDRWNERVQRASLLLLLGDHGRAKTDLETVLEEATKLELARVELDTLMFLTRMGHETHYVSRAREICDDMHLSRERVVLEFNMVEAQLVSDNHAAASRLADHLYDHPFLETEDVEIARTTNTLGEVALKNMDVERAERFLEKALRAGRRSELLPELVTTYSLLGSIELERGNFEIGFSHFRNALACARHIAASVDDESLKQTYQSTRTVKSLVENVRRLQSRLGKKSAPSS